MVKMPRQVKRYSPKAGRHTMHTIERVKKRRASELKWGQRRFRRVTARQGQSTLMNPYQGRYTDVEPFRPMDWLLASVGVVLFVNRILVDGSKGFAKASCWANFLWSSGIDCGVRVKNQGWRFV